MKRIRDMTWHDMVYYTGVLTWVVFGVWLTYWALIGFGCVLEFLSEFISPFWGILAVFALGFLGAFHDVLPIPRHK